MIPIPLSGPASGRLVKPRSKWPEGALSSSRSNERREGSLLGVIACIKGLARLLSHAGSATPAQGQHTKGRLVPTATELRA